MPKPASEDIDARTPEWYVGAMERLVAVVRELSRARSVDAITAIVRDAARSLTGADGATFVLRDGEQCYYADENAIAPLWKGRRFPMTDCVSGWVMLHRRSVVIENVYADPRVLVEAYRPTFVQSMAMVPIRNCSPIGAIGNYWASSHVATPRELAILQALADTTSVALENVELHSQLTEQLRATREQQARIQRQRDTLEVFTRAMAHDLKEPVRAMHSFARLLLEPAGCADEQRRYLQFVQSGAERMNMLVDSVLRYMQFDDSTQPVSDVCPMTRVVREACENLAQMVAERKTVIACDELPVVRGDHAFLVQVVQNLIANAIIHNTAPVTIHFSAHRRSDHWQIAVRDNGVGVAPDHVERIFQPFKRLSNLCNTAGLGLAMCEKVIARCGGKIWCESQPGHGATFYFSLPSAGGVTSLSPAYASASPNPPPHAEACILLVDDRPDDLTLTRLMLAKKALLKCRVLTAENGEDALEILRTQPVDVVLLDINMPGIDGFEVLDRIRQDQALSRVTVIMCTGSDYIVDKQRAKSLGAAGYIVKPPSFDALRPVLDGVPTLRFEPHSDGIALVRTCAAAA